MGKYDRLWEWIYENYDINNYFSDQELIYDVEQRFNKDGHYFPEGARDLIRERFQYRREYVEMQERQAEQKQIAEFIGSGKVPESLSDEILDDIRNPKAEIMGIDMTEFRTDREEVVPPDIVRFAEKQTFFGRIASTFRRLLRFGR